jgi:hypothetical protein
VKADAIAAPEILGEDAKVHWAYNVKSTVWPCMYGKLMVVPPLAATNQPLNVYPACTGLPGFETVPPVVVDPFETALPP